MMRAKPSIARSGALPVLVPALADSDVVHAWQLGARALAQRGITRIYDAGILPLPGVVAMNAPFGHGDEKLTERQVDEIIEDLTMSMDADNTQDMKYGWAQVNAAEAAEIEKDAANGKGTKYTSAQLTHIHTVLEKYLKIDKHKSSFSL